MSIQFGGMDEDSASTLLLSTVFRMTFVFLAIATRKCIALAALAIVLLIPRAAPVWKIAFHRLAELSIGIAVALLIATLWPEQEDTASGNQ